MSTGCDYSFARPSMAQLKSCGVTWVGRYLTGSGKALTAPERDEIHGAGLGIVLIFEAGVANAQGAASQGYADGSSAKAAADALGAPPDVAIYWTVDEGAPASPAIQSYGKAFAAAIQPHPAGVYADGSILDDANHQGYAEWLWQTNATAWPGGRYPSAHIYQGQSGLGGDIDMDEATVPAFGAWPPAPAQGSPAAPAAQPTTYAEDNVQNIPVHIPALDNQGNGYVDVPGVAGKVVSVKLNAADPATHGYTAVARWESCAIGADERVVIVGGVPGGELDLNVWAVS